MAWPGKCCGSSGWTPGGFAAESHRFRLRQMQTIERVVRPLHAGVKRKRRVREELLVHLAAICEEEQRGGAVDELAALDAAARRFGDPADLARDLQRSMPRSERFDYYVVDRWLGWRAPETVFRMLLRTSLISFALLALTAGIPIVCATVLLREWRPGVGPAAPVLRGGGDNAGGPIHVRLVLLQGARCPMGAFGTPRSALTAGLWSLGAGIAVFACALGFILAVHEPAVPLTESILISALAGAAAAITCGVLAPRSGPGRNPRRDLGVARPGMRGRAIPIRAMPAPPGFRPLKSFAAARANQAARGDDGRLAAGSVRGDTAAPIHIFEDGLRGLLVLGRRLLPLGQSLHAYGGLLLLFLLVGAVGLGLLLGRLLFRGLR